MGYLLLAILFLGRELLEIVMSLICGTIFPIGMPRLAWVLSLAILILLNSGLCADDRLERVLANLRAWEDAYPADIEVVIRYEYRHHDPDFLPSFLFESAQGTRRTVKQGPWLYFREEQSHRYSRGWPGTYIGTHAYDGQLTRSVLQGGPAHIFPYREEANEMFRSHTLLVNGLMSFIYFPLSVFLTGGEELQKHPSEAAKDYRKVTRYIGEEGTDGLHCVKLRFDCFRTDKEAPSEPFGWGHIWLAVDRNYQPVKLDYYKVLWSRDLPEGVAWASDWREISPGLWLPFQATVIGYNPEILKAEGRLVPWHTTRYVFEEVRLRPQYDVSLFRDIPIADGTHVYVMGEDNEIQGSYTQGTTERPNPFLGLSLHGWLVVTLASTIIVLACLSLWWRRRALKAK
jgi:hypothetical protein